MDYAGQWYQKTFGGLVQDQNLMRHTVLISAFDESEKSSLNQIYVSLVSSLIKPGAYGDSLNLYSLLKLIEDNWGLGSLQRNDTQAPPIPDIWK